MLKKGLLLGVALGVWAVAFNAVAADELLVENSKISDMSISVYNNNLAFVRDVRKVLLNAGKNSIAFEGVASQIKPETAMVSGNGIEVLEQNYDYDLLTADNIMEQFIGENVKTAIVNPSNGQNVFDKAKLLNSNNGNPILQFEYGVEANFPGRVVFEKIPSTLRVKPTLVVNLKNNAAAEKELELAYLTTGISWKADYIAEIKSDETLNLNTWITLNNETGADYENAKVQLISGSINQVRDYYAPVMPRMMLAKGMNSADAMVAAEAGTAVRTNLADYYLYTLPIRTTIKNKQSKQISLMQLNNVKYKKEYLLRSPLYLGVGVNSGEFKKQTPEVVFKLVNDKASNLGEPLPAGTMRFYEKDDGNNMQFIGESRIEQAAKDEKIDLTVGQAFDVYAQGKIKNVKSVSKDMSEIKVEIVFNNVSSKNKTVAFEQNVSYNWEILNESMKSEKKNASTLKWTFDMPQNSKKVLEFDVRVYRNR